MFLFSSTLRRATTLRRARPGFYPFRRSAGPFLIPLGVEYVRFLIKVAQTAHLSEAVQEAASVSYMNPRKSALIRGFDLVVVRVHSWLQFFGCGPRLRWALGALCGFLFFWFRPKAGLCALWLICSFVQKAQIQYHGFHFRASPLSRSC